MFPTIVNINILTEDVLLVYFVKAFEIVVLHSKLKSYCYCFAML